VTTAQDDHVLTPAEQADGPLFDVAVIGAGPMGSFTAERLARAGLSVALFEKDANPGDSTVCAGGMHVDLIDFIDLPEKLVEKTLPVFRVDISGRITEWHFKERTYFTIHRRDLDMFLAGRALEAGVKLFTRSRVVGVEWTAQRLTYEYGPERTVQQARAKVFVFADGPNSLARRILVDAPQEGHPPQFLGVEYDLAAESNTFQALEILPDPEALPFGYVWVFPKRDHVNVGLARLNAIEGDPLWKLLDEFVAKRPDLKGRTVLRRKGGVIPATLGPVLQRDNCLVVGDAAGMINPLTGGGYVCGFVSATLAAQACIEAFRGGRLDVAALRRYPQRLRLTKHYIVIRVASVFLNLLLFAYRMLRAPVYLKVLNAYFRMIHVAMRFVPVVSLGGASPPLPGSSSWGVRDAPPKPP
jgi:digeranylgeranylglycerophospholipid reductase